MHKVRITVLKTDFDPELAARYLTDGVETGPCPIQKVGDTYVYEGGAEKPDGLCPWAWVDIYRSVSTLNSGGSFAPWNTRDGQTIVCCTDGIRPVVYELTALS